MLHNTTPTPVSTPSRTKTSSHISTATIHFPHTKPTIQILSPFVSRTLPAAVPEPFHTRPLDPPAGSLHRPHQSGQKPIFIAFEIIGGLVISIFLIGLLHCCYQCNRAPKRDRIAEARNRHHLQQELEDLDRNSRILRRPSLCEPAPPYFPPPPSYHIVVSPPTTADVHYTDMDTHNLPQSPHLVPPRPAGDEH